MRDINLPITLKHYAVAQFVLSGRENLKFVSVFKRSRCKAVSVRFAGHPGRGKLGGILCAANPFTFRQYVFDAAGGYVSDSFCW
jgi:hypothetical protein